MCGSCSASHISLVPEKYGSRRSPVSSVTRSSWPSARSRSQMSAVRRSCQTMARRGEPSVSRSHSRIVSRWLVMPTACSSARSTCVRTSRGRPPGWPARSPPAACSTQPGCGKCCAELLVALGRDPAVVGDDDGGDAGGAGVDGEDAHWGLRRPAEDLEDPSGRSTRPVGGDPHLVVLGADPGVEVARALRPCASASSSSSSVVGDRDLLLLGRRGQVEVVEVEQPGQLGDRVGVVVDPQVDGDVVEAAVPGALPDDEQRRRLPAAACRRPPRRRRSGPRAAGGRAARRRRSVCHAASIASTTSSPVRMLPWIA